MHTNLIPDTFPGAVLPAPVIGLKDRFFRRISTGLAGRTESVNKAKPDFLADISHEIRTPMGAIIGLSHGLLSTNLDNKQKECVMLLKSSAEALLEMVNRTLDSRKIDSGTLDPKNAPFDIAVLLDQIVNIMSVKAQEKNIGLRLHCEGEASKRFIGDSGRTRQIVMNLVGNAIKFTEKGEVTVSLATDRNDISISVADTGIGIAEDKIDVIFDRFAQADSSIGLKYGGSGLGLSISKALAEDMGGTITVNSMAGKGSTFVLHLPPPIGVSNEGCYQENVIHLNKTANAKSWPRTPQFQ